jgi:hypothetical protein
MLVVINVDFFFGKKESNTYNSRETKKIVVGPKLRPN